MTKKKIIFGSVFAAIVLLLIFSGKGKSPKNTADESPPSDAKIISPENPKPRGSRLLGLGVSEGSIGFEKAFTIAKSVGVQVIELPTSWDDAEKSPGKYEDGWLPTADQYYSAAGIQLGLGFNPIDSNNLRLPKDLRDKKFNDPEVVSRYKAFVDFAASKLPHTQVAYITIGNEVDSYLGNDKTRWAEYTEFFNAVAPYVKQKFPNAVVGVKMTFGGLTTKTTEAKALTQQADAILATYYPFKQGSFAVESPDAALSDFKRITELYPAKKIYFAEIGYPSGSDNQSNTMQQAMFVHEAFAAWDAYSSNIPLLNFQWLHDQSPQAVSDWQKYYGLKDKGFASFLGTLGLRTYDGKDKQAFLQFKAETKARGW